MSAIALVHGRRVWDSRGRPTVEAELRLASGVTGRAIAPAGASTGSGEARDLRDDGEKFGGFDVTRAVSHVNGEIARAVLGRDAADQAGLDAALIALDGTADKSRLGGNALLAVSMAAAHAAAAEAGEPLWRHLGGDAATLLPLPQIQIFGGGAHAGRRVDIQDFLVVCPAAGSFAEALDWTAEIYRAAGDLMREAGTVQGVADEGGWWPAFSANEQALEMLVRAIERAGFAPGRQVAIALDIAASEFGRDGNYRLGLENRALDREAMIRLLLDWIDRYPIVSVEDPLAEDDPAGFSAFTARGGRPGAGGRRRLPRHRRRAHPRCRRGGSCQRGAAETQPARHADRDAGGVAGGAAGRVRRHRFGPLGRDRGCHDRPPRGRLGRRPAQGRLVRPQRANGEVERGAAHRAGPWAARPLRRRRGARTDAAMNVLFHYAVGPDLAARLATLPLAIKTCPEADETRLATLLPTVDVLWHVLKPCTAELMAAAPRLRLIQKIGVGVNTIDLDAARARGIAVCNLPGTNAPAVAELTLLLMLAALRRLPRFDAATRAGQGWSLDPAIQDGLGELGGRTVGLVGYGAIPQLLAPVLAALGSQVLYTARAPRADAAGEFRPLDDLLAESDVVSLHVPLTPETENLIDATRLARMKRGAVLINTARGGLVAEAALVAALRSGQLGAAGLDVFAQEPADPANPLFALDTVVLTPHVAWITTGTFDRSLSIAAENVRRIAAGEDLLHRVA